MVPDVIMPYENLQTNSHTLKETLKKVSSERRGLLVSI